MVEIEYPRSLLCANQWTSAPCFRWLWDNTRWPAAVYLTDERRIVLRGSGLCPENLDELIRRLG